MAKGKRLISRKAIYQQLVTCGAETPAALVPGPYCGANGISRGSTDVSSTATDSKMDDTSGQGSRTLAVWYTYSMTFKLGVERKGLGAAVPILTPN